MTTITKKIKHILTSRGNIQTPLYIADVDIFRENVNDLVSAFKCRYPNFRIAYCMKSCYYEDFVNDCIATGLPIEVSSEREYILALKYGAEKSSIIWNGLIPSSRKIEVINHGGIVNIDNFEELNEMVESHHHINVGVRFNFDFGYPSRFGIEPNENNLSRLSQMVKEGFISIDCVSCHVTCAKDIDLFRKRIENLAVLAKRFGSKYLDFGGNLCGRVEKELEVQLPGYRPTYDEYADAICEIMNKEFPKQDVTLIAECGTPILGNTMALLTKVISRKEVIGKTAIAIDTSKFQTGFVCCNHNAPIVPIGTGKTEMCDIYGSTCLEDDLLCKDVECNCVIGDYIIINSIGAYALNLCNDFIIQKPNVKNVNSL